jgi:excinuclease ABC subunit C
VRLKALSAHVRAGTRNRPGVYRFLGPRGEVLYVGKAVRIRARLLSWLRHGSGESCSGQGHSRDGHLGLGRARDRSSRDKGWELLRVTRSIDWEYLPTEFEALLREFRLIRTLRPSHNVHHRRDRRFAWIGLTAGPTPRLRALRSPSPGGSQVDGTTLFGPFPASRNLPELLRQLTHLQEIRDCPDTTPMAFADQLDLLPEHRPALCPRGDSGGCLAPCAGRCSLQEYRTRIRDTAAFLRGECDRPLHALRERAGSVSAHRDPAVAARLRNAEEELRRLRDDLVSFRLWRESLTFIYRVPLATGSFRCYLLSRGQVRLAFDEPVAPDGKGEAQNSAATYQSAAVARRVEEFLSCPEPRDAVLSAEEREELFLTTRWFRNRPEELQRTESPEQWLARSGTPAAPGGSLPVQPVPHPHSHRAPG